MPSYITLLVVIALVIIVSLYIVSNNKRMTVFIITSMLFLLLIFGSYTVSDKLTAVFYCNPTECKDAIESPIFFLGVILSAVITAVCKVSIFDNIPEEAYTKRRGQKPTSHK